MEKHPMSGPYPTLGYNTDISSTTLFSSESSKQFGYQVLQIGKGSEARVIVGAPGEQNTTGAVYQCSMQSKTCQDVPLDGSSGVSHLGLTLASNSQGSQMIACGPGLAQHCDKNLYVSGLCYLLDAKLNKPQSISTGYQKCLKANVDLVFLFDGSESMKSNEFKNIKEFMIDAMEKLSNQTIHFAAVQFSQKPTLEFDFNNYIRDPNPRKLLANVTHAKSITNTYRAIKFVVDRVLIPERGTRPGANKVIILITDGDATDRDNGSIEKAKEKGILRLVIGIGKNYNKTASRVFASTPATQFVKFLDSFEQLKDSFSDLRSKIFAIEGTSDSGSFHLELSSSGLSADISQGRVILGAVGVNNWAGGLLEQQEDLTSEKLISTPLDRRDMQGAYLGYALKFLQRQQGEFYAVGAPRYEHVGRVLLFEVNLTTTNWTLKQEIPGQQIGSYFGAVLCSVDVNNDGETDLLLVGAHLHFGGPGGRVYVYGWRQGELIRLGELQGKPGNPLGRFGAAIADLTDINGDDFMDVAVGAPLEDGEAGVVYIYNGNGRTLHMEHSQRIEGARISPGLKFFGQSIHGKTDLSGDGLPDIAVGALGKVAVLHSRPIVTVATTVQFSPKEIPIKDVECLGNASSWKMAEVDLSICFSVTLATRSYKGPLSANLSFHLEIDRNRMKNRGVFKNHEKATNGIQKISLGSVCVPEKIHFLNCLEDYVSPIKVFVNLSLESDGEPNKMYPRPFLNPQSNRTTTEVHFEKNCGADDVCDADMRVRFHDSQSKVLVVMPGKVLYVVLEVENRGEDAYYVTLHMPHIPGLSFRRAQVLKSTAQTIVNCDGMVEDQDSEGLSCNISHPVYREKKKALIQILFGILDNKSWGDNVTIKAVVRSNNEANKTLDDNWNITQIPVQYPINIIVKNLDTSVHYVNFSSLDQENKTVTHSYEVTHRPMGAFPPPSLIAFVKVPSIILPGLKWEVNSIQTDPSVICKPVEMDKKGSGETYDNRNHIHLTEECAVDKYDIYLCDLGQINSSFIRITGVVYATRRTEQSFQSTFCTVLWLTFDARRYNNYHKTEFKSQVRTEVEIIVAMNYLPIIIGSGIGGLVLLILIIVLLYKCGFFKRNYKQRMDLQENSVVEEDNPEGSEEGDKEKEANGIADPLNTEAESN
ncbi:integrin alpha-L [Tiliqua scincoides]|uniref:integrin alpha-L n=1 Tax=Tiliqua scincoides TaxID=71010 RepID=UPI00346203DE